MKYYGIFENIRNMFFHVQGWTKVKREALIGSDEINNSSENKHEQNSVGSIPNYYIIVINHIKLVLIAFLCIFSPICVSAQAENEKSLKFADDCFATGVELYNEGKYQEAQISFERCEQIESYLLPDSLPKRAYPRIWIAACLYKLGDTNSAQSISDHYYSPIDRRLTVESDSIAEIGNRCLSNGNIDDAIKYYQASAIIEKEKLGTTSPWYGNSMLNIINAQTYSLYENSFISIKCINDCLKDLCQVYSSNEVFLKQTIGLFSNIIQPIRNLAFNYAKNNSIDDDEEYPFESFYTNLINIYRCTENAILLDETDEYYGRAIEEYANVLMMCGKQEETFDFLSAILKTCNIQRQINANSIISELSMGRLYIQTGDVKKGKNIYYKVFRTIENEMDIETIPVRIWIEDRVVKAQKILDALDLNSMVVEIAFKCRSATSFSLIENVNFSMLLATLYKEANEYDAALGVYSTLCNELSLMDSPNDFDPFLKMANLEEAMENYLEAIRIYKHIENYASTSLFDKVILYKHLSDCYNSINDKTNYEIYTDKHLQLLIHLLKTELSEDNIDRTMMAPDEILAFDFTKQDIIKQLYYYYYENKFLNEACSILDYAFEYYCKIKDNRECVNALINYSQVYGYGGYQNAEKSNKYLSQAIRLCDSLDTITEMKEHYLGECYSLKAFNYESLSAEPELALVYYEKAIEHKINDLFNLKNSNYFPQETKEKLFRTCWESINHDIFAYSSLCNDIGIITNFVSKSYSRIADVLIDILPEEDWFDLKFNSYQLDFDMNSVSFSPGYNKNVNIDKCKLRIRDIENLFKQHKGVVSIRYMNSLAQDYLIIGDTTSALAKFQKAIVLYESNPSNDYFILSDYIESVKSISEIKGDRTWIEICISKLINDSTQYDSQYRLMLVKLAIDKLDFAFSDKLDDKEEKELDNYLIELETKLIHDYRNGKGFSSRTLTILGDTTMMYDRLLKYCIRANRYDVLKNHYSGCADACNESIIRRQSPVFLSGLDASDGIGLGEILSLEYPEEEFDNGRIYDGISLRKTANLAVSIAFSNLIKETSDSLLIAKYHRVERLKNSFRTDDTCILDQGRVLNRDEALWLINRFESEIYENSQYVIDFSSSLKISWREIQATLDIDEAAIEFSKFTDLQGEGQYAAVILRSTGAPMFVHLFDENTMLDLMKKDIVSDSKSYDAIWGPIFEHLYGIQTIFVSPDGDLQRIPFEYVLYNDKPLTETYKVFRVSSTRSLINRKKHKNNNIKNVALFGGINYEKADTTNYSKTIFAFKQDRGHIKKAKYLPATLREIEAIIELCKSKSINVELFSDIEGSESNFKRISHKDIDIVHVATHGYYIPEGKKFSLVYASKNDSLVISNYDLSLLRSGLLMAGANYYCSLERPIDFEDGVLTAFEISLLDLRKTDFFVLSACKTGLGDISVEGVFGLSRGLKKAGANSIMMSLWKVDDDATNAMMTKFYEYYLSGLSKYESLIQSQKFIRSCVNRGWDNPKYWAAFILLDSLD